MGKILFVDRFLKGRPHALHKEGFELFAAAKNIGLSTAIAGKDCEISEHEIPRIAKDFDLIVISENYPGVEGGWGWWDWGKIKTPKCFWAIDTHLVNYRSWIEEVGINYIAFNNCKHIFKSKSIKSFWLPYGVSTQIKNEIQTVRKENDVVFIGGLTKDREKLIKKYEIKHVTAFGSNYYDQMARAKICFNKSISDDINAKYFEILGSGSFMLTNYNKYVDLLFNGDNDIRSQMYKYNWQIGKKIKYFLQNEEEREAIARRSYEIVRRDHTYENRLQTIIENCQ